MLRASNICKRYGDTVVLEKVSFTINSGDRVGLIGPNGCGKTTLLRIIAGRETADEGHLRIEPSDLTIGYLEQGLTYNEQDTIDDILRPEHRQLQAAEAEVARLAQALSSAQGETLAYLLDAYAEALSHLEQIASQEIPAHQAAEVLASLNMEHIPPATPVYQLSGGQRTRLGLARLLIQNPQILFLDEPTNHLDIEALEWLEDWLTDYAGAVLLVSHDRTFLDRTVKWIFELDGKTHKLTAFPGTYSDYLEAKQRQTEEQWRAYRAQQERIAHLSSEARRLKGYANRIESGTIDFAPRKIAKGIARRAVVQRRRIERELSQERMEKPTSSWQMKLDFSAVPESGQEVLTLSDLTVGYGSQSLVRNISATVRLGERIALVGPNGSGKTTLLRTISGTLPPLEGEIKIGTNVRLGVYAQEQETLQPDSTPFATIRDVTTISDTDVRAFLHYFLFTGDDVFVPVQDLSYGQRARLILARLVASGCNFLLLDEPINHLDIPSRTSFEQAMTAFRGTVIMVVHDRTFIRTFASRIWAIHAGRLHNCLDLSDYHRIRAQA